MRKKTELLLKRWFDIVVSLLLLILLFPLFMMIALLIKLDSPGNYLFIQTRVGKMGKEFKIYKFRTMLQDTSVNYQYEINTECIDDFIFQHKDDNRITRIGRFLRKTSLDELPQLVNVLIGNMSLVGPRPEIPEIVAKYPKRYKKRLIMTPGITGLAQINGRSALTLSETIDYDLEYIDNFSLYEDFKILCSTLVCVLMRDNAY
ncbi:sugar transferase [Clostridium oryzae]|uniref:UDP-glucose:undecaprenyl-phosphate glucose-1-phosphate transferase n=1 Tax=Clostridium oryzae TaxID=1450648 RepID=A0A1V4IYE1_9CLOT|nr:sugar transferase [Clostridium oryzae]OPJ65088.1 UDP-glucose:undecaprenyl-phosphate glucose-1-phosphate transferase [Clostridium oryzae]